MKTGSGKFKKLALLIAAILFVAVPLFAQSTGPASHDATPTAQIGQSNAGETEKTSSEDETAQFKHSASVKLISRVTGLSLNGAYWLAVGINFAIVVFVIAWASKKHLP